MSEWESFMWDKSGDIDNSNDNTDIESDITYMNFDSEISHDLSQLNDDIVNNYSLSVQEKKLIDSIDNWPIFNPSLTLKNYIEKKEWSKVVFEFFSIIWRLLSHKNEIWFNEFNNLDIRSLKLDEKNASELSALIKVFEKKIDETSDIKKDLTFTYVLSTIKNKLLEKEHWIKDKEEQLKKNLAVWDVILLNKEVGKKDIWTKLLEAYDSNYDTDFWHVAIVIATDPLTVRHSTTETWKKSDKDWFVEETELNSYLSRCKCNWYDLISLRPSEEIKNKILLFSEQNLWKEYDANSAIAWWLYWQDRKWKSSFNFSEEWDDQYFNCVEIIAQALDHDKLSKITHPNEFLEYMDVFTPTYLTTISRRF